MVDSLLATFWQFIAMEVAFWFFIPMIFPGIKKSFIFKGL
jgi:hypothetical protein